MHGSNLDITERKKMERELKEREERFRKIFELSPAGILLFDSEGFLTHANQASQKILEVIDVKHKRYNLFRDLLGDIEKHHKLLSGQIVREGRWINIKPGKAAKLDKLDKDMLQNKTGQIYIENQVAVLGEADKPVGYLCIQQDITEKKLADEIMISENERLQIIYDLWKNRVKISDMKLKDFQ
jgi:PAS domain S-box-containing protein